MTVDLFPNHSTNRANQGLIVYFFADGGEASLGIRHALGREPDVAFNHDPIAMNLHAANHPGIRNIIRMDKL